MPATDNKDVPTYEKKTPQKNPLVVLDLTQDKVNQYIQKAIDAMPINELSKFRYYENGRWKDGTRYCLWEKHAEFVSAILSNEIQMERETDFVVLPVDLRATHRNSKISDLKNKFEKWRTKGGRIRNNTWKPLHVQLQKKGADITFHRIGDTYNKKDGVYPHRNTADVKLDYYSGESGNIVLECYLCDNRGVFKKSGWIWNDTKYLIYFVDDEMFIFDHHKMRELVEKAGPPVLVDRPNIYGTTNKVVEGNYRANTYSDNYDSKTGEGKYTYQLPVEDARAMALRIVPVPDTYLSFIADRAEAYRDLYDGDLYKSQDRWIDRMVRKNEERKQQRT